MPNQTGGYNYIAVYVLLIILFILTVRTKIGYNIAYYFMVVTIVLLLLTNYRAIATLFGNAPIGNTAATSQGTWQKSLQPGIIS